MLYRTQEWLPLINNLCKYVLDNNVTLDMKAQFWASFSNRSHWFNILSGQNAQEVVLYLWRSLKRHYLNFMQLATFIMQNWFIYTIRRCASCRMNMGKDEFHSYREEGFFTIQCSDWFWGDVWSDMSTDTYKNGLWWAHARVKNYRGHSGKVGGWHSVYRHVLQLRSPMAVKVSLLSSIVRHVTATGRSGAVYLERQSSSTAFWVFWWRSRFTVFCHHW